MGMGLKRRDEEGYGREPRAESRMLSALCPLLFPSRSYTPPVVRVPVLKSDTLGRFEKSVVLPFPPVV
jgi:hypothetical protein